VWKEELDMSERYPELDKVLDYINRHLDEPLSLTILAQYAGYSPYHFLRIFKEKMGLSPQYYVSSLRLQKAKQLLLHTKMSVRDIGLEIGQQSLGTFTTRFKERVGVTPSSFRSSTLDVDNQLRSLQHHKHWHTSISASQLSNSTIHGTVHATVAFDGIILIGLFARPIPEGLPLYGTLIPSLGEFFIPNVKQGTYYLMATSVPWGVQAIEVLLPHNTLRTRSKQPIIVNRNAPVPHQQVTLHVPHLEDPPILISLPLLMNNFISRVKQNSSR
jgi:AraC family transcriptional regulator